MAPRMPGLLAAAVPLWDFIIHCVTVPEGLASGRGDGCLWNSPGPHLGPVPDNHRGQQSRVASPLPRPARRRLSGASAAKTMIRIVPTFLVQPNGFTCDSHMSWGASVGSNWSFCFYFFKFWQFLFTANTQQDAAPCLVLGREGAFPSLQPPGRTSQVPVSQPGGPLRILFLALKTQAVFPLEEPVMCGNIRDIAEWLRGVTGNISPEH